MRTIAILALLSALPAMADDDRNGWPLLAEAGKLINRGEPGVYLRTYPDPWHPARPAIASYLANNAPALAKLDEALAKPELHRPADWYQDASGDRFKAFAHWRELARLKSQRAHLRRAQGDLQGALRDCEDVLTLAERLDQSGGLAIDYLVTRAVQGIALANAGLLLGPPPVGWEPAMFPPREQWPVPAYGPAERAALLAFASHVADERGCLPAVQSALAGEHRYFAVELRELNSQLPAPLTEAEIEQLAQWRRRCTEAAAAYAALAAWQRPAELTHPSAPAAVAKFGEAAEQIADASFLGHLAKRLDADRAGRRMTVVAIALRLYAGDHGRLPATLADLVQEGYLPTVPLDPLSNGAIGYDLARGILTCGPRVDGLPRADLRTRLDFVATVGLNPSPPAAEDWSEWIFERDLLDRMNERMRPRHGWSVLR